MRYIRTLILAFYAVTVADIAFAQTDYLQQGNNYARHYRSRNNTNGIAANGRCGGISYGTGQRSCGTATGGPVGGNSSRN